MDDTSRPEARGDSQDAAAPERTTPESAAASSASTPPATAACIEPDQAAAPAGGAARDAPARRPPFPPGHQIAGRGYTVVRTLHVGSRSTTYLCVDSDPERWAERVAVKVFDSGAAAEGRAYHAAEAEAHDLLRDADPFYAQPLIRAVSWDLPDACPSLTSDFMEHGSLTGTRLALPNLAVVGYQLLTALSFLKRAGLVHRGVQPKSLLVVDLGRMAVKLGGIGSLTRVGEAAASAACAPGFRAPEVLEGRQHGHPADAFAAGMTLFHLLTGPRGCLTPRGAAALLRDPADELAYYEDVLRLRHTRTSEPGAFEPGGVRRGIFDALMQARVRDKELCEAFRVIVDLLDWDPDTRDTPEAALQSPFFARYQAPIDAAMAVHAAMAGLVADASAEHVSEGEGAAEEGAAEEGEAEGGEGEPASRPEGECAVCKRAQRQCALVPCGHFCLCRACSDKVRATSGTCPVCRAAIACTLRVYS